MRLFCIIAAIFWQLLNNFRIASHFLPSFLSLDCIQTEYPRLDFAFCRLILLFCILYSVVVSIGILIIFAYCVLFSFVVCSPLIIHRCILSTFVCPISSIKLSFECFMVNHLNFSFFVQTKPILFVKKK